MSNSKYRYRRGARRLAGVLAATAVVGAGAVATTGVAYADENESLPTLETFDAADFASQAAELPTGMVDAIERDLGLSAEQYLANAEAAKVAAEVVAQLEADGVGINGASIDGQDVTIYVSAEAEVELLASIGATIEVGEPPEKDYSDYEVEPKDDLKGGYGYVSFVGEEPNSRCSIGFNGYDGGGSDRVLTAGHCGVDGPDGNDLGDVYHLDLDEPVGPDGVASLDDLGEFIGAHVPGSNHFGFEVWHDGGLIDATGDWGNVPQVSQWGGGAGSPQDGAVTVYDHIAPMVGQEACSSGATTGWTCGEVFAEDEQVNYGDEAHVQGFIFGACMFGGDSGGSIVVGNYALGVNSGGSVLPDGSTCADWVPGDHIGIGYALTGTEYNAFELFGSDWELNVEVATPEVDATANESGATLDGTVANAAANHSVSVTVDGLGDFEADVNADGEFTVEIDEALEVGAEYSYTATASYGAYSQSEAATGTFTVEEGEPEPDVAELVIDSPSDGQTTSNTRPPFEGTGEPGAELTLTVGDNEFGAATVGDEGDWTLEPDSDLPVGQRFDATVTQVAGEDVQEATVSDLGIEADEVTITVPEDGAEVSGDVVFEGTSFPGASIGLQIEGEIEVSAGELAAADDHLDDWPGEFEIDDQGNWTFDPDEDLENGSYTLTAMATMEGGDPELTDSEASVDFTVNNDQGGDEDGGDENGGDEGGDEDGGDLPDTGSSSMPMILIGVGLLAAGGGAVALRARRNAASNA
ncbi:LPXTG cell wall anchor domain-containing protein [Phytoactinopolyspora halotolerans]|uniref:LPXTG cell wall anchor domain-containing protein n=1 Tax=Phytoactinopolyspora halotolerans TaxID=1981512 RepID=A0A6L9SB78_9ACTN|nr:Ig-like domain-containing protein [Phytoactinopolyspora halotolerans]NEE02526.1 LPXTG cell wall anchor domain-containing protein [Phytoactinopolyspora halotolerans]